MDKIRVRCTKTKDERFILDEIYELVPTECDVESIVMLWYSADGRERTYMPNKIYENAEELFDRWHYECHWCDYDFELLPSNKMEVDLI